MPRRVPFLTEPGLKPDKPRVRRMPLPTHATVGRSVWAQEMQEWVGLKRVENEYAWRRTGNDEAKKGRLVNKRLKEFLKYKYPHIPSPFLLPSERQILLQIMRLVFDTDYEYV